MTVWVASATVEENCRRDLEVSANCLSASITSSENIQMFKKLLKEVEFSYAMFGKVHCDIQ